jgi:hypothetical protein
MGLDARHSRRMGLGSCRRRWRSVAPVDEGAVAAYERLVRVGVGGFSVSAQCLDSEETYWHRGFRMGSGWLRTSLFYCWENRVDGANLSVNAILRQLTISSTVRSWTADEPQ